MSATFIENFHLKRGKERTIRLRGLPGLKPNQWYQEKGSPTKYPIKRMAWIQQSDKPNKVVILEQIDFEQKQELRLRYYIMGKKPGSRGRWTFGQYAVIIPVSDFLSLLNVASKNGLLPSDLAQSANLIPEFRVHL